MQAVKIAYGAQQENDNQASPNLRRKTSSSRDVDMPGKLSGPPSTLAG